MTAVCVVGGGPAGLAAAIHAARAGASVTLLERNDRCGVKLLATGGGRCNVSNLRPAPEWSALFGRHGRFILPALEFLPLERLKAFFSGIGQPLIAPDGFHLYPASNSARAVRDALLAEALRLGVSVRYGRRLEDVTIDAGGNVRIEGCAPFDGIVLATGGRSRPATGSTGDGFRLARAAGYKTNPAKPGLVGLRATNLSPDLAGVVLSQAEVLSKTRGRKAECGSGELLLTHNGVSGPAVLDLSAAVAESLGETDESPAKGEAVLRIRWIAAMPPAAWLEKFAEWRSAGGGTGIESLLRRYLPQRLARWLCGRAGLGNAAVASLGAKAREELAESLGSFPVRVIGTEGWEKAMVTRGGVDVRRIDPADLKGRLTGNLYFAGETADVDGPCGGYNLHWAFASGALAGTSAASSRRVPVPARSKRRIVAADGENPR